MKRLLAVLVICLLFISSFAHAADMNAKFSFMELFITEWCDKSNIKVDPEMYVGGVTIPAGAYMNWFGNVFDSSMSLPVLENDMLKLSTFFFNETCTELGGANIQWWFDTRFAFADDMLKLRLGCEQYTKFDYANLSTLSIKEVMLKPELRFGINKPDTIGVWIVDTCAWNYDTANNTAPTINQTIGYKVGGPGVDTIRNDKATIWHGNDSFIRHWLGTQYSFGLGWVLAQEFCFNLDTNFAAHGDANANETLLSTAQVDTFAGVIFDVLTLAKIENLSLSVLLIQELDITMPYCSGPEQTKNIDTHGLYGVELGLYGFVLGFYLELATQDTYNTSLPIDGSMNSSNDYWNSAGNSTSRAPGSGTLGPAFKFQYFAGNWGGVNYAFRFEYHGGYAVRDYDADKDNFVAAGKTIWSNTFRADWFIFF